MARRNRFTSQNIIIAITVFFLFVIILTWETRDEISPVEKSITHVIIPIQKGTTYFGDWLIEKVDFLKNINELESQNQDLLEEVDRLNYENEILNQSKEELDTLRDLYELDQQYADYPKTGARVIGKDPGNWYSVFTIDKGEDDGIAVDMVVMADAGLVGRIIEVGPGYSKVRSIIDDTSSVSGKIKRTRDLCTVRGDLTLYNEGLISVEYIPDDVNIIIEDEIITSHLGEVYPPGILIGEVVSVDEEPGKMSQVAYIRPVVDFKHLENVLVINRNWSQ